MMHVLRIEGAFMLAAALWAMPSIAQDLPTIPVADSIGCRNWEVLEKLLEYNRSGDKVAAGKFAAAAFVAGECIRFKWGQQVYPTEWGPWTHSLRLRPAGETVEYWTITPDRWQPAEYATGKLSRIGLAP
jgi:hypothetical protein